MFGTMSARWHKVLREVWGHKARTALVVLSMAAGVFGVGMMASTRLMLLRELNSAYMAIHPAHAELQANPFDDDLLKAMRRIPGLVEVEGRTSLAARLLAADKEYMLGLEVVADYEHRSVHCCLSAGITGEGGRAGACSAAWRLWRRGAHGGDWPGSLSGRYALGCLRGVGKGIYFRRQLTLWSL
jgi:hypothetical protein